MNDSIRQNPIDTGCGSGSVNRSENCASAIGANAKCFLPNTDENRLTRHTQNGTTPVFMMNKECLR